VSLLGSVPIDLTSYRWANALVIAPHDPVVFHGFVGMFVRTVVGQVLVNPVQTALVDVTADNSARAGEAQLKDITDLGDTNPSVVSDKAVPIWAPRLTRLWQVDGWVFPKLLAKVPDKVGAVVVHAASALSQLLVKFWLVPLPGEEVLKGFVPINISLPTGVDGGERKQPTTKHFVERVRCQCLPVTDLTRSLFLSDGPKEGVSG
jgi:hypothetical protein